MSTPHLRHLHKSWWAEIARLKVCFFQLELSHAKIRAEFLFDHGFLPLPPVRPSLPKYPPECIDMVCGARGRHKRRPCQNKNIGINGRCRFHGGLSTGPKTAEGKAISAANLPQSKPHGAPHKS